MPKIHPAISVKSKLPLGFWRAGRRFTREATLIAADELTDAQYKAITKEPNLTVVETGESDADRAKREKAEAAAAEKANREALAREKAATKKAEDKAAWEAAEKAARTDAADVDDAGWAAMPASERVARIEAKLAQGKQ